MNIGTAKPSIDELKEVKHYFIDSHSIESEYNAGQFGRDAENLLNILFEENKSIVAVGGSGLYLKALWEGFDEIPEVHRRIRKKLNTFFQKNGAALLLEELKKSDSDYYEEVDKNNGQRIIRALEVIRGTGKPFSSFRKASHRELPYQNIKIGLNMERELLFAKINYRIDQMIEAGLFDEARSLFQYRDHNALQTVGYSEIFGFLDGNYNEAEAVRLLKRNSRRYAKRQLTWLRRYEDIVWFGPNEFDNIMDHINNSLTSSS